MLQKKWIMFIREVKNRSGSVSVQIINKPFGKYKVVKTVGCGAKRHEIDRLKQLAKQEVQRIKAQSSLFVFETDELAETMVSSLSNDCIRTVGPELIFGRIYDHIGYLCRCRQH